MPLPKAATRHCHLNVERRNIETVRVIVLPVSKNYKILNTVPAEVDTVNAINDVNEGLL